MFGSAVLAQPAPGGPAPVITEIMYNPPETGNDSLEFIEILNPSLTAVINMGGFYIDDAFSFTFPSGFVLGMGEHVVIAGDSVIFEAAFGVEAFEWDGATTQLNNSGETITLKTGAGAIVDQVQYGTTMSWPQEANGQGYSLVLCDPTSDNSLAASWTASENATGVVVNALQIYADPGAFSTCTPTGLADDNIITTAIYPNPSEGAVSIRFAAMEEVGALSILNSLGQVVHTQGLSVGTSNVNLDLELSTGYYIVSLDRGNSVEKHKLIIK